MHRSCRGNPGLHAFLAGMRERVTGANCLVCVFCSSHTALRGELSPAKRQARQYEQDLALARQESTVRAQGTVVLWAETCRAHWMSCTASQHAEQVQLQRAVM